LITGIVGGGYMGFVAVTIDTFLEVALLSLAVGRDFFRFCEREHFMLTFCLTDVW
jgi:hypothetical protein